MRGAVGNMLKQAVIRTAFQLFLHYFHQIPVVKLIWLPPFGFIHPEGGGGNFPLLIHRHCSISPLSQIAGIGFSHVRWQQQAHICRRGESRDRPRLEYMLAVIETGKGEEVSGSRIESYGKSFR